MIGRIPNDYRRLVATALWAVSVGVLLRTANQNGPQGRGYKL
jgi:hypothetical protein